MHFCASFMRSSNSGAMVIWYVFVLGLGIHLFVRGFKLLQRRRLILDTPFSKIRSASLGMIEVTGLAVGPYAVTAPVTERECYYYRTLAWEWKQQGKSKAWVQVAAESVHVPFFLDDNTGRVLVDPRQADLDLHRDFQSEFCDSFFTTKGPAPANVRGFLARHGVATNNKIKVEEFCIKPKNSLFIFGTLAENPGIEVTAKAIHDQDISHSPSGTRALPHLEGSLQISIFSNKSNLSDGFNDRLFSLAMQQGSPERVVRLPPESAPLQSTEMTQQQKIAAALTKAGISNPAAWAAAGIDRGEVAVSESKPSYDASDTTAGRPSSFESRPPVVLMKGTKNRTFIISWRSQRELALSLGWKCTLMIWGGPAIAIAGLYFLLNLARH